MKKTLYMKVAYPVVGMNETQIDLLKAMLLAGMDGLMKSRISFEVLAEDDEQQQAEQMMHRVRNEFRKIDGKRERQKRSND